MEILRELGDELSGGVGDDGLHLDQPVPQDQVDGHADRQHQHHWDGDSQDLAGTDL